ncbi:MAG: N-acetylmuramoyl-L-alanine amidase [Ruminococcus sp.]|nr:N-acetylmuramoyl-L-alanine amidase [Ruminococcus sp.]
MAYSSLVNYVSNKKTNNFNYPRNHVIDRITIHHAANGSGCNRGYAANTLQAIFDSVGRNGSCNYAIDSNGNIGLMLEEQYRSWCTNSQSNDYRAITIECANDGGDPDWHVSDKALASIIKLCADICKRNNIKELRYTGDLTGNLTLHKWFAATGCPGPYLISKMTYIASEVNKLIKSSSTPAATPSSGTNTKPAADKIYRVRKSWTDAKSQIGAYKTLANAKKVCKEGYKVFDSSGNVVYEPAAAFQPYLIKVVCEALNIRKGAGTGYAVVSTIAKNGVYTIVAEKKVAGQMWGKLKSGAGWICVEPQFVKKV